MGGCGGRHEIPSGVRDTSAPGPDRPRNQADPTARRRSFPVVGAGGSLRYQNDGNKADISGFLETAQFEIDLVVTGHLHVAEHARVQGCRTPVLVTGATVPISTYEEDSNPSTWLLTATESGTDLQRRPL